ncbi:MAG: ferritin [Candidatus Omnitrophica bacterium]|nr:ferritin [Candidatus Omnitrophota bacterium]
MNKRLLKAFNDQIRNELYSAYLYLAMAAWSETKNLGGFSRWMQVQAREETGHAMKLFGFLSARGARVQLQAIPQPPVEFSSPQDVFAKTLEHEQKVTAMLNKLSDIAGDVDDKAAEIFLQWFITEQVEEEQSATTILETLKAIKPDSAALIMLDRELGRRQE